MNKFEYIVYYLVTSPIIIVCLTLVSLVEYYEEVKYDYELKFPKKKNAATRSN